MQNKPVFLVKQSSHRHYVYGVDGLRTLAVVGVIGYHLLPTFLPGGFLGVPLFLIISGYFVTSQLLRRWQHEQPLQLTAFYRRRARRLYPVLATMLAATSVYILFFARTLLYHLRQIVFFNLAGVYNWWEIANGQSYFDRFTQQSPFTHLWTMGVLMQFYLLWPLLLWGLLKLFGKRSTVRRLVFLLAILSAVEMALLYRPDNINRVYYGTDTRAFSLLLGCWLAFVWPHERLKTNLNQQSRRWLDVVGLGSLLLTLVGFVLMHGEGRAAYEGGMFGYSVAGLLLLATIVHQGSSLSKWFAHPLCQWVGRRSYGIYVYQYPVMVFYERLVAVGLHPLINAVVELVLILGISELSYRFVERPLAHYDWTNWRSTIRSWFQPGQFKVWLRVIPALLFCGMFAAALSAPEKAPQKNAVQRHIEQATTATANQNKRVAAGKTAKVKVSSKSLHRKYALSKGQLAPAKKLKVTVIGDSVMADASKNIQQVMPAAYVDAQVGRQGSQAPAIIKDLKKQGHLQKIVVLNLGTNGMMSTATVGKIIDAIGPGHQIYWVNSHIPTKDWQGAVNKLILKVARQRGDVYLVDWYSLSQHHQNWFANDNVHMNEQGNVQFTRLIVTTILKHH
ncbi:acyltransferase family protein [uncultured Limosilactobacillus sp.]|uniref:acyltransferase family protein n=1 Tax=uncultured Limosilactobacillus sp. TaxID=2837629 RepID=UPI0025FD5D21|nr:acyltransferase family protein [uncultured Limosilactobacillus sp.]